MVPQPTYALKVIFSAILAASLAPHSLSCAADADPGRVYGVVFYDANGNGIRDRGEPGFSGIAVSLFGKKSDGTSLYLTTRTDSAGNFAFAGSLIGDRSSFTVSTGGAPLAAHITTAYRPARTFYTATDGNDKNAGTRDKPFRSISHAAAMLEPGDLLYVRQGVYRDYVSSGKTSLRGGTGWDRPVVVCGMPGETIVVLPPERDLSDPLINLTLPQQQYLVFDNLVLDAEYLTLPLKSQPPEAKGIPPGHVRVINCELRNSASSGAVVAGDDHQFFNCRVHDNGRNKTDHGFLIGGGRNLVQGCDVWHNAGSGVCVFNEATETASNNVLRGNRVHNNGLAVLRGNSPGGQGGYGIVLYSGHKNLVYDNVVWGNPFGIIVATDMDTLSRKGNVPPDSGPAEESIFNNTVTGNLAFGVGIASDMETHDNIVRNNIILGNRDPNLLCFKPNRNAAICDHNQIDGNPLFRDPLANDFHLQPRSVAIDAGLEIPQVRFDHDGVPRPQGKGYDRGAYEYCEDSLVPTTSRYSNLYFSGQNFVVGIGFAKQKALLTREAKP